MALLNIIIVVSPDLSAVWHQEAEQAAHFRLYLRDSWSAPTRGNNCHGVEQIESLAEIGGPFFFFPRPSSFPQGYSTHQAVALGGTGI